MSDRFLCTSKTKPKKKPFSRMMYIFRFSPSLRCVACICQTPIHSRSEWCDHVRQCRTFLDLSSIEQQNLAQCLLNASIFEKKY